MSIDILTKAPADVLDYDFDFGRWLPSGDAIQSAEAILTGTAAVVDRVDTDETKARVWLSGGAAADNGSLTVTISTKEGRTKQVSATLRVRDTR